MRRRSLLGQRKGLLLDLYPNAKLAYSFRKLRNSYSGACIRVRRSSDDAEADIPFDGLYIDEAALLAHVGAGDGFIRTWYDQSTNAKDWEQTLNSQQSKIVDTGVINKTSGFVSCRSLNGIVENLILDITAGYLPSTSHDYVAGYMPSGAGAFILNTGQTGSYFSFVGESGSSGTSINSNVGTPVLNINGTDQSPTTRTQVYTLIAINSKILITQKNLNLSTWTSLRLDYNFSLGFSGLRQTFEKIIFPDNTNLADIQANINDYYTIY